MLRQGLQSRFCLCRGAVRVHIVRAHVLGPRQLRNQLRCLQHLPDALQGPGDAVQVCLNGLSLGFRVVPAVFVQQGFQLLSSLLQGLPVCELHGVFGYPLHCALHVRQLPLRRVDPVQEPVAGVQDFLQLLLFLPGGAGTVCLHGPDGFQDFPVGGCGIPLRQALYGLGQDADGLHGHCGQGLVPRQIRGLYDIDRLPVPRKRQAAGGRLPVQGHGSQIPIRHLRSLGGIVCTARLYPCDYRRRQVELHAPGCIIHLVPRQIRGLDVDYNPASIFGRNREAVPGRPAFYFQQLRLGQYVP